jgi:hypothetical protein
MQIKADKILSGKENLLILHRKRKNASLAQLARARDL